MKAAEQETLRAGREERSQRREMPAEQEALTAEEGLGQKEAGILLLQQKMQRILSALRC